MASEVSDIGPQRPLIIARIYSDESWIRAEGKALDSADTHEQIHRTVQRLKDALTVPVEAKAKFGQVRVSFVSVYRWAQQEGVESTLFWLLEKLKGLSKNGYYSSSVKGYRESGGRFVWRRIHVPNETSP